MHPPIWKSPALAIPATSECSDDLCRRSSLDIVETALDFVNHWNWAGSKGLMANKTAMAFTLACRSILSIQDGWEDLDFGTLEVDGFLIRFKNLRKYDFKPRSLATYEGRFRRAVESYQKYLSDPAGWRYDSRRPARVTPSRRTERSPSIGTADQISPDSISAGPARNLLQEYTYPFRPDILSRLHVPRDAKTAEINRLVAWARTLAVDYEPST